MCIAQAAGLSLIMDKIAFLVYDSIKAAHRADRSFDGMSNIGAKVIEDVLAKNGYQVDRCVPETAHEYNLILVSFTSVFDMLSFYRAVALRPEWQPNKRAFKVFGGGFGMQNPTAIRNYLDFAAFGRAHLWVADVVRDILDGKTPCHDSVMTLPEMGDVVISQAPLYDGDGLTFRLGTKDIPYTEQFTGCPLKCKFCHYTWARKHTVADGQDAHDYVQMLYQNDNSPELTFDQLFTLKNKVGRPRVAIDGFSERLRYVYGKRILDDDITNGINALGEFGGSTMLKVYNISNFPTETEGDRETLYAAIRKADPRGRVVVDLHSTPFRPSLGTPMQWEKVTLFPQWSDVRYTTIVAGDRHSEAGVRAYHSKYLDSVYTHLIEAVIIRANHNTDKLFHAIAFAPKLKNGRALDKYKLLDANFDLDQYLREYDVDEDPPAPFLASNADVSVLRRVARKMRVEANDNNWTPKGKSLVTVRIDKMKA